MCNSKHHQFLQELPKCEHHLHIEGSLSPSLLFRLAKVNNIALPDSSIDSSFASIEALEARYERFTSLNDFLHYYFIGMSVLINASDFESLAYEYFTRAHKDGVHHAEIFFDPQAHTERGIEYKTVVTGLVAAQVRAERDFGLTSKLILCFLRHLSAGDADVSYEKAVALGHFSDGTLAGIGMDSSEVGFPPEIFREVYDKAYAAGIRRTAHAGEEGDSTYISRALDICRTERIDHGIRLVDDEALLKRVAKNKTLVTMCPLSNVRLRCVTKVAELPIRKFLDEGVRFSINSDDPAYFGGYILDNYCAVQDAFSLSFKDWKFIAEGAVEGSWCDDGRKEALLQKVQEWAGRYEGKF
ncbi:Metallo-dependent hydrolase [Glarea lozoyensis ATCC 20868]|uniref:Adenine deaminase n=1 Tax=Glarea lozoyensis (strain ATCC 20868 / MF5171) TaxID=1116229 RepID=S3DLK9_GLAL2|nr:Metallo-dependent hydrolase [Glarea lozoyensis ATCC 20868]EPE32936.1 Metallo-dependent hydrolase [Glarea lozoyensis ATCC 20868]